MRWQENAELAAASDEKDDESGSASSGTISAGVGAEPSAELERKARIALRLYLVLAVVAWFTLDGTVQMYGRQVEIRLVPLIVLGGLAAKTLLAVKAEKIRRASSQDREESLKG